MRGPEYCHSNLKRKYDIAVASAALPPSSPFWLTMHFYNKLRSEPTLFAQERLGKDGKPFNILKFETLYSGAELEEEHNNNINFPQQAREELDQRVPNHAMRFMRKSGFNELPQAINVLKGDMSIVGPRPMPKFHFNEARELFPQLLKEWTETAMTIKPGWVGTSPLQTRHLPVQEFDQRVFEDIRYFQQATLWQDICITAEAMVALVRNK